MTEIRLTELSTSGGCAAKIGPGDLHQILAGLSLKTTPDLLVGLDAADDAAVYRLNDRTAIIQTLDFFTPIVNDPYLFGQIAAANALSDVYAMGGRPILAMNIFAFPCGLGVETLQAVLKGGADKVQEAGAVVVGGHSLEDKEPKYGLSVCGLVDPDRLVVNAGAAPGDVLVLTKPLGLGILTSAIRDQAVLESEIEEPLAEAVKLNRAAAQSMNEVGVNAATDITGFGLAGHLVQMLKASSCSAELEAEEIPVWSMALSLAQEHQPGGTGRNSKYFGPEVRLDSAKARSLAPLIFDPQTSGGLLISVPEKKVGRLVKDLGNRGVTTRAVIGRVGPDGGDRRVKIV
ncbi:MAG TPA: selenide, water dikinase SelD [Actinobacteria bacterium]|nr:selenide, water dikinase SelD [Actinomycetota bacterium]